MICKRMINGFGILLLLWSTVAASAGVPKTINYQGYLKDSSGLAYSTYR